MMLMEMGRKTPTMEKVEILYRTAMRSCQRRPAREYKHADTNQITLALLGRPIIDSVRALVARRIARASRRHDWRRQ
jgi:hypothetical protein